MSRLSRDQNDRIRLLLSVDESGVDLHSVERGLVDTSDYKLAIEAAMAASDDVGKRKEIERAKRETERRLEKGDYQGRPSYGHTFDDAGERLVPRAKFDVAVRVLELRDAGRSYRETANGLDPATYSL
ncbi:Resolvase domain-containing protein [Natronococcus jeotgali DSM 18795]|uniref:Resolvase domain-containing protein n=1 Tax=Natronococcus jeotgali DSM 18795 TaxID=1227498 RepID=L9WXJ6_9EURY|nr:Resolvase domain-containing protein [Natronococcus jeotgali DSM 18795]